jgi:hypothetical protein
MTKNCIGLLHLESAKRMYTRAYTKIFMGSLKFININILKNFKNPNTEIFKTFHCM